MTPIPPDAKRYVIAAVVPCDTTTCSDPCDGLVGSPCSDDPNVLDRCNGDGTRTVVTDIEVEQVCIAEEGMYEELVWREVER